MRQLYFSFACFLFSFFSLSAQHETFCANSVPANSIEAFSEADYALALAAVQDPTTRPTDAQWRCLYFGSTYLVAYSPYVEEETIKAVRRIRLVDKDNAETLTTTDRLLRHNPAFLELYFHQAKSASRLGDNVKAQRAMNNYLELLAVPMSSGDGRTPATAFVVRTLADVDLILHHLNVGEIVKRVTKWAAGGHPYLMVRSLLPDGRKGQHYFDLYYPYVVGADRLVAKFGRGGR